MYLRGTALVALALVAGCQAYNHAEYELLTDGWPRTTDHADDATRPDVLATSDAGVPDASDATPDDRAALDAPTDTPTDAPIDSPTDAPLDVPIDSPTLDAQPDAQPDAPPVNQFVNTSFETTGASWLIPWSLYVNPVAMATVSQDGTTATDGHFSARIDEPVGGTLNWHVQLNCHRINTIAGRLETLTFSARSSVPMSNSIGVQLDMPPSTTYASAGFSTTTSWQTFTLHYTSSTTDPASEFAFNVGGHAGTLWIDDLTLTP